MITRIINMTIAILLIICLSIPLFILSVIIKLTSKGPVLYWSNRVGKHNKIFKMAKFRTMRMDTPAVATHLLNNAEKYLTPLGPFLRKFSLDELPQLLNIISGDMTFVGPRPALFNQDDLVALRTKKNIHTLVPGLTGWAQINGRDELSIPQKVAFEEYYLNHRSFFLDIYILLMTILKVMKKEGVNH